MEGHRISGLIDRKHYSAIWAHNASIISLVVELKNSIESDYIPYHDIIRDCPQNTARNIDEKLFRNYVEEYIKKNIFNR